MKFEHNFTVGTDIEKVWDFILDLKKISICIPGCEKIEALTEDSFRAIVKVGISLLKAQFDVKIFVTEKNHPIHVAIKVSGKANRIGSTMEATSSIDLRPIAEGRVQIGWSAEVTVTGKLASFGQRVMQMTGKRLINQFVNCLKQRLESTEPQIAQVS